MADKKLLEEYLKRGMEPPTEKDKSRVDYLGKPDPTDAPGIDYSTERTLSPLEEKMFQAEQEQKARFNSRAYKPELGGIVNSSKQQDPLDFMSRPEYAAKNSVIELDNPAVQRHMAAQRTDAPFIVEGGSPTPLHPTQVSFAAGQEAYQKKDFFQAARAFDAAHKANPSSITALAKARALDHAGSSDEAQKSYLEAVTGHHHPEGAPVLTQEQHDHAERRIMAIGGPRAAQLQRTNSNIRDAALEFARQGHPDPLQAAHHQIYGTGLNADDVARSRLTTPMDKATSPGVSDAEHRELQTRRDALLNEKTQELARQLAAQGHENALAEAKQLILSRYGSQYVTPTQEKQQVLDLDVRKANQAITEGQRGAAALHYLDAAKIAPEKDKGAFNAARAQQVAEMYDRPEHAEYAWDFAKRAYDEGDYALATQLFMKAYKLNPHPDTHAAAMDSYFKSMSGKERIVPQKVAPEKK